MHLPLLQEWYRDNLVLPYTHCLPCSLDDVPYRNLVVVDMGYVDEMVRMEVRWRKVLLDQMDEHIHCCMHHHLDYKLIDVDCTS